jgi:NADH-quinone oxidoreductase subunit C
MALSPSTLSAIQERFPAITSSEFRGQARIAVDSSQVSELFACLRQTFRFDMLVDITCVDYLNYRGAAHRFGLVYLLCNTESGERITVRVYLDEDRPTIASLVPIWEGANWMEREVWDMFGIKFHGHPDLRRILMPEEFTAHPLRKDYPLQGRGERHNFPVITRTQG